MRHKYRTIAVIIGALVAVIVVWLWVWNRTPQSNGVDQRQTESVIDEDKVTTMQNVVSDHRDQPQTANSSSPKELIGSIYDEELGYTQKAVEAAEDTISHFDTSSYLRWRPVRIDPKAYLNGSYLNDGSMPERIRISPFPDVSLIAVKSKYTIMQDIQSALWEGSIVGSDNGRVEITIVGGDSNPAFSVRIVQYPQVIQIFQTDISDVYLALETNPNPSISE